MLNSRKWSIAMATLCLVLFTGLTSFAQKPRPGGDRSEAMKAELNLTEGQAVQFDALEKNHRQQMRALRQQEGEPDREQMKALRQSHKAELQKILSPEQMEKMKELRQEHRQNKRQGKGGHPMGKVDKQKRKELHQLMLQQRVKLEASISPTDKEKLNGLRAELAAVKPELKEKRKPIKAAKKAGEKPTCEMREECRPLREQKKAIMQEAAAIGQNYETQIRNLHEEVKPQLDALVGEMQHPPRHLQQGEHPKGPAHHQQKMVARFMLLDPNKGNSQAFLEDLPEMEVYPNPSRGSNAITYHLTNPGHVKIELLSKEGQVVKTVFDGEKPSGTYIQHVENSELGTNLYYYKVTTAEGVVTKRFTVAK